MADIDKRRTFSKIAFGCALALILASTLLYLYNIIKWGDQRDYGYDYRRTRES